ncbi:MAG TPA: hypothetical protein VE093_38995 [Polyangiaceae bacterium]|nr:hypothetical protein [Polyangiaceae bacterium]
MNINIARLILFMVTLSAVGCVADVDDEGDLGNTPLEEVVAEEVGVTEQGLTVLTVPALIMARYYPPWVGGDQDFKGHGPNVYTQVELVIFNGNELWAAVWMDAIETKSDWTHAQGTKWYLLYKASKNIAGISSPSFFEHQYTDTNHSNDIFSFPPNTLVKKLDYIGDTYGNEAGSKTSVQIYFNPISLTLY